MQKSVGAAALRSIPLVVLSLAYLWLFQRCLSESTAAGPASDCSSPPLLMLGLLGLSFVELTRGSRVRGAVALLLVAIPFLLRVVSDVIN